MARTRCVDWSRFWQTENEGSEGCRAIRLVLLAAVCSALTLGMTGRATADEDPPGCASLGGNALGGGISASSLVLDGDRINYTVSVFNLAGTCLANDVEVRFWPPDMTPNNFPSVCGSTNGIMLADGLTVEPGQTWKFDVNGACSFFTPDEDCQTEGDPIPALNYTVTHADEPLLAYRCASGVSHVGPIDGVAQAQGNFPTTVIHPDLAIDKDADISWICEGVETPVNYTYTVTNPGDVDLEDVIVSDDLCGPVVRQLDSPGNDDDILEPGEVWNYTCNALISQETTSMATVTAQDIYLGGAVMDTNTGTVFADETPSCSVDPPIAAICDGGPPVEFCAVPTGGTPPYMYDWNTGEMTQCIEVTKAGEYCVTVTDDNGCASDLFCAALESSENPTCNITPTACPVPVELTANPSGGSEPYSYLWNTGATTQTITANVNGLYMVTVTDSNGCQGTCEFQVNCETDQGCTASYWKEVVRPNDQHLGNWPQTPYGPYQLFANTDSNGDGTGVFFDDAFPGKTLLAVLSQAAAADPGPNQLNNLGRHAVAALLNAAHPNVAYDLTSLEVITMFNDVYPGTIKDYNGLKSVLTGLSHQYCPPDPGTGDDELMGIPDLMIIINNWGNSGLGDVNQDGVVGMDDLLLMFDWWGS